MTRLIPLAALSLCWGCAATIDAPLATGPGPYSLPVAISPSVVIVDVDKKRYPNERPITLTYELDGVRRSLSIEEAGDSDGFVTYLGHQFRTEKKNPPKPYDGPIIDEEVIRLATGEEIVIGGNIVLGSKIWIRKLP